MPYSPFHINWDKTVAWAITVARGIRKSGTNILTVSGANTYNGGTIISKGTVIGNHATAFGTGTVTVGDSGTGNSDIKLQFNANVIDGQIGVVTVANTGSSGTATLAVNQNIAVDATLVLNRATTFIGMGNVANNQAIRNPISGTGAGAGNDTIIIDNGSGNWLLMYVDVLASVGANTYTGNLRVKTGNLQIGNYAGQPVDPGNANKCIPDTSSVTVDAGCTLRFVWMGGGETFDALNGSGTLDRNTGDGQGVVMLTIGANNGSGTFSGSITSSIGFIKTGTGTQTFSGANTFTGSVTVNNGTLAYGASNVLGTGAVTVDGASAILSIDGFSDSVGAVTLANGAQITGTTGVLSSTVSYTVQSGSISAIISGAGVPLNKTTSGTVTLTGNNTYTGATTSTEGVLNINGTQTGGSTFNTNPGSGVTTTVNINGSFNSTNTTYCNNTVGTSVVNVNGTHNISGFTLIGQSGSGSSATVNVPSGGTLNVTNADFRIANASSSQTVTGVLNVESGGTVNMNTAGTVLRIANGSGTTGTLNMNGGVLTVNGDIRGDNPVSASAGTNTVNLNGGTLKAAATITTFLQGMDVCNVRNGGAIIDTNGFNITIAQLMQHSAIGGDNATDGGLLKKGTGTLTLTAANTYNGLTRIQIGTLDWTGAEVSDNIQIDVSNSSPTTSNSGRMITSGLTELTGKTINIVVTETGTFSYDFATNALLTDGGPTWQINGSTVTPGTPNGNGTTLDYSSATGVGTISR